MFEIDETISKAKKLKLLYVEDLEEVRISTMDVLEEFFDEIIIGVDGNDGLEKFKNNDIDLIITDVEMPILSGLEMAKYIRIIDEEIPILVLSAYDEADYFMDSIKLNIDGYLLKPLDIGQFTQALSKCINNIVIKKENLEYVEYLESKVKTQIKKLSKKDEFLFEEFKTLSNTKVENVVNYQMNKPLEILTVASELIDINVLLDNLEKDKL